MRRLISLLSILLVAGCGAGNSISNHPTDDAEVLPDPDAEPRPDSEVPGLCGNSVIDPGEICDGQNFGGMDCHVLGFEGGELGCTEDCQLDTNNCVFDVPECGNSIAELGEACDGEDLSGETCSSQGFNGGSLACLADCGDFDTSACWVNPPTCGNGAVEPGEMCDDGNHVLTDWCPDGPQGTCQLASCGDGFVEAGQEDCDDGNHSTQDDCPDGPLGTCEWAQCGDGFVHGMDEVCDDGNAIDDLTCYADCSGFCGDGVWDIQHDERCDDAQTPPGTVCYADCSGFCGDGIVHDGVTFNNTYQMVFPDHGEECDGSADCNPDCTFGVCGDGQCSGNEHDSCNVDCDCVQLGGVVCGTGCCYGEGVYMAAQCCQNNLCAVWDAPWQPGVGVLNCGTCGNTCFTGSCHLGQCQSNP